MAVSGISSLITDAALMPPPPGIEMSSRHTSGFVSRASATACSPSAASAHTSNPPRLEGLAHARARRRVVVGDEHASGLGVRFGRSLIALVKHRGSPEPPVPYMFLLRAGVNRLRGIGWAAGIGASIGERGAAPQGTPGWFCVQTTERGCLAGRDPRDSPGGIDLLDVEHGLVVVLVGDAHGRRVAVDFERVDLELVVALREVLLDLAGAALPGLAARRCRRAPREDLLADLGSRRRRGRRSRTRPRAARPRRRCRRSCPRCC